MSRFQVKDFELFRTAEAIKNARLAFWLDGGKAARDSLAAGGDPILPLTEWILKDATENGEITLHQFLQQRQQMDEFRCTFSEHWESQDVDLLIFPVFVGTACFHDTAWYGIYTSLWNYLDYPGISVPNLIPSRRFEREKRFTSPTFLSARDVSTSGNCMNKEISRGLQSIFRLLHSRTLTIV